MLVYAVECGLKAAWLRRNSLTSSADIAELKEYGHDLRYWVKKLHLPASVTNCQSSFRVRGGGSFEISSAHQAWRYGVDLDAEDEAAIAAWLETVWAWGKGELGS